MSRSSGDKKLQARRSVKHPASFPSLVRVSRLPPTDVGNIGSVSQAQDAVSASKSKGRKILTSNVPFVLTHGLSTQAALARYAASDAGQEQRAQLISALESASEADGDALIITAEGLRLTTSCVSKEALHQGGSTKTLKGDAASDTAREWDFELLQRLVQLYEPSAFFE